MVFLIFLFHKREVNKLLKQFEQTRKMMKMAVDGSLQQRLKAFRR